MHRPIPTRFFLINRKALKYRKRVPMMFAVIQHNDGDYYRGEIPGKFATSEPGWASDLQQAKAFKLSVEWKQEGQHLRSARIVSDPPLPDFYEQWDCCQLRSINLELK